MEIRELVLEAPDPAALESFYSTTLGLPTRREDEALIIQAGATRLSFTPAAPGSQPLYHFAFNIPENLFEAGRAWLAERAPLLRRNGEQEVFDFQEWDAHACYFADPAGNILELIARHNRPNAAPGPFGPAHLLRISEIGLPGPTVAHVADALAEGPGLAIYSGDREHFAAVGDERGLFIVVPEGRLWLPDDRVPAAACPVRATISGARPGTYRVPARPYTIHAVP
ncbi:MAG: hypothetical protein JXN59_00115 [Anaerolineae bacterium]|nr:hypothetical protein [Anaerolineae bacterium]